MSTTVDLDADPAALADHLREATERGASLLAGGDRAAGPATPQDGAADLVPAADAVGLAAAVGDGLTVVVMVVPDLAEELTGQREAIGLVEGLAAVVDEIAGGLGLPAGAVRPLASPAELDAAVVAPDLLMASGIFAGDAVVATVGLAMAPGAPAAADATAADPMAVDPSTAATTPVPTAAVPDGAVPHPGSNPGADALVAGATHPTPGTAVPPRGAVAHREPLPGEPVPAPIEEASLVRGLQILAEVNLEVTAELGRAALRVSELLDLQPGAIIELDRDAGAPVELFVNGTLFARAEVVVVDGAYAVRICELLGGGATR